MAVDPGLMPTISVTWCPNPLRPASDRQALTVALVPGDTVQAIVGRLGLASTPLAVVINGRPLGAEQWSATPVAVSDLLVLRQVPKGVVEGSAVTAKLIMSANMAYGTAFVLGTAIAFAANAAIAFAVSTLASSLARKSSSSAYAADDAPTAYSVEGGSNSARPYEPLQLVLGEHRVYPDYACRPFAEYVLDPTTTTEVINNTPVYETQTHPDFGFSAGEVLSPWVLISTTGSATDGDLLAYYGDGASRTYTSSSGGTVTRPHTFVVRHTASTDQVATYEDYLTLIADTGDDGSSGGDGPSDSSGDDGSDSGDSSGDSGDSGDGGGM
ncbi:MAG: hypothetical protein QM617_04810 [Comamonas sp.]